MTAGLPGTGISSIFYFLLTLFMPVHELILLYRGRSSWRRWRFIGRQWMMLAGMIGGMWGWAWLVNLFCTKCVEIYASLTGQSLEKLTAALFLHRTGAILFASAFGSLISLSLVISAVFTTRAIVRWRRGRAGFQSASKPASGLEAAMAPVALREPVALEPAK